VVLGRELAWKLGAQVGAPVTIVTPEGQLTPAGLLPRLRRFTVVGIFEIGMYEFDSGLVLLHLDDAATLYQMKGKVSGLRLKIDDIYRAPQRRSSSTNSSVTTTGCATGRASTPTFSARSRWKRP